jgi:hypothetical protein
VVGVSFLVLASSEQPEIPIPRPMARTPIMVRLISFFMDVPLIVGDTEAGDLT